MRSEGCCFAFYVFVMFDKVHYTVCAKVSDKKYHDAADSIQPKSPSNEAPHTSGNGGGNYFY